MAESISSTTALTPETTVRVLRGETPPPVTSSPPGAALQQQAAPAAATTTATVTQEAVSRIEAFISSHTRELEFRVDEQSGRTVVTVRELGSGEMIRQIPPEEILALAATIESGQSGDSLSGLLLQART